VAEGELQAIRRDGSVFKGYGRIADQTLRTVTLVSAVKD
jgi:hypothetical protein